MKKTLSIILLVIAVSSIAFAEETYSYEKSEQLKSTIHWQEYGTDAFTQAAQENKPIFLLLTAPSWCYWCQVYESEDYLFNSRVAAYINQNFIPVYVNADRRQDLQFPRRTLDESPFSDIGRLDGDGHRLESFRRYGFARG